MTNKKTPTLPRLTPICGDLPMRIDRNGTWFYQGTPIGRKEMVRLFSTILQRRPNGEYWLVTPYEEGRISVEDAPFLAVEMEVSGEGSDQILRFRTNVDDWMTLDAAHPLRMGANGMESGVLQDGGTGPAPYVLVRDALEAKIARAVYYDLIALGTEETTASGRTFGIWSSKTFFPIGSLEAQP